MKRKTFYKWMTVVSLASLIPLNILVMGSIKFGLITTVSEYVALIIMVFAIEAIDKKLKD